MPKIRCEKTEGRYLKPGDMFSDKGPEYWLNVKTLSAEVFLCVKDMEPDDKEVVYRISVVPDRPQVNKPSGPMMDPHNPPGL